MKRRRWILVLLPLVAAGAWWWADATHGDDLGGWVVVERDDLVRRVEVEGTLRSIESATLGPPQVQDFWDFKIAYMAPEGETVVPGVPVLGFDTAELERRLLRQGTEADEAAKKIEKTVKDLEVSDRGDRMRLSVAEANLRKNRLKVEQTREFSSDRDVALLRLDLELAVEEVDYLRNRLAASRRSAEAQLGALRNQESRARQRVESIRQAIADMMRSAPREGTVVYVTNWRGEKKKVGDTCWRREDVLELPDLSRMRAAGEVDEADAARLAEGQQVSLRLDAHPDIEFSGRIASIRRSVQRKSWRNPLKVARLEIELAETDTQRMRPGMRFRGRIEVERITAALQVPIEAVFVGEAGPLVLRKTGMGFETAAVELGRRNESHIEVLSGIDEGDRISRIDRRSARERS